MLHGVEPYESSSPSESSLAVNGHSSGLPLGNVEECANNIFWRSGAIDEEQIRMINAVAKELIAIVFGLIKPNNPGDIKMLKDLNIVLWSIASPFKFANVI